MNTRQRLLVKIALLYLCVMVVAVGAKMFMVDGEWLSPTHEPPPPGLSPTSNPNIYAVTPVLPFWMTEEWQRSEELRKRAQDFYDCSECMIESGIENPLFKQAFPQARMYAVRIENLHNDPPIVRYVTAVSLGNHNYKMPRDFNQLMFDAGYELTTENLDLLAHALIIAALPTEMIMQPVTCEPGRRIDELVNVPGTSIQYIYEVHCYATEYQDIHLITKFEEFDDQFLCVDITESAESRKALVFFCPSRRIQEE